MFEEAAAQGLKLTIDQTIKILTDSARRNPPGGTAWNDRYGFGRISAARAIKAIIALGAGGGAGAAAAATTTAAAKPRAKARRTKKPSKPRKPKS